MFGRILAGSVVMLTWVLVGAGGVRAQADAFGPMPPFHDLQLCAIQFEKLLAEGGGGSAVEAHSETVAIIEALSRQELYKVAARVEGELGPLAWSLFVPGEPNAAEKRFEEELARACVRRSLARGAAGGDAAVRARTLELLNHHDVMPALPERLFMDGASATSDSSASTVTSLRVVLPPSELIVPGGLLTGRVVLDDGFEGIPVEALAGGLLAEVAGQTARVGRQGLFVLRAPESAGTYTLEVRHESRALLVPVEESFTIVPRGVTGATAGGAAEATVAADLPPRPEVDCPGFDRYLDGVIAGEANATAPADCSIAFPRVLLPDERLIVLGRLGNRSGRATRAFVGRWEAPLLARTPIAAIFDASDVPAGRHVLTLYEGPWLKAAAPLRRVRLAASSDRVQLARGDMATFEVRVEGLPFSPAGASEAPPDRRGAAPIAFLDYVNRSPETGKFHDQADGFTVPIAPAALSPEPEPSPIEDQAALFDRVEKLVAMTPVEVGGDASYTGRRAQTGTTAAVATNSAVADVQRYRGTGGGEYHVQVSLRLPEETRHGPAIFLPEPAPEGAAGAQAARAPVVPESSIGEPLGSTGIDERGVFAAIDGKRVYFSPLAQEEGEAPYDAPLHGPRQTRLFDASCSGSCQCSIQSWNHASEVGAQVAALDRSRPEWRAVTAKAETCGCDQARAACYGLLSLECRTRCKRLFESSRTDFVSGFATDATINACSDRAACDR